MQEVLSDGVIHVFTRMSREFIPPRGVRRYNRVRGAWFEYAHTIDGLDLSDFQIFHVKDIQTDERPCIVYALSKSGCDKDMIDFLQTCVAKTTNSLSMVKLKKISERFKVQILVHTLRVAGGVNRDGSVKYCKRINYFPSKRCNFEKQVNICLYNRHYFAFNKDTKVSKSALLNPEKAKLKCTNGRWWTVLLKPREKYMNSWRLVKTLLEIKNGSSEDLSTAINLADSENDAFEPLKYLTKLDRLEQTVRLKNYLKLSHTFTDLQYKKDDFIAPYGVRPRIDQSLKEAVDEWEIREIKKRESREDVDAIHPKMLFAFDFETTTDREFHKAYMVSVQRIMPCQFGKPLQEVKLSSTDKQFQVSTFIGENCARKMLLHVCKMWDKERNIYSQGVSLIAHNAGYDLSFLFREFDGNFCPKFIRGGLGKLKKFQAKFTYQDSLSLNNVAPTPTLSSQGKKRKRYSSEKSVFVDVRDSLNFTMCPLSHFPKMFNLGDIEKEIMPYEIYTERFCFPTATDDPLNGMKLLSVVKKFIRDKEIDNPKEIYSVNEGVQGCVQNHVNRRVESRLSQFMKNCEEWNCLFPINDEIYVDMIRYSRIYCERDVEILAKGYCKLRHMFNHVTKGLSIDDYISVNHLTNYALQLAGCTEGVKELSGIPRDFIQHCVTGGKCMLRNNQKQKVVGKKLADFDAVSLYPSAMAEMPGLLKGFPKIIPENISLGELNELIDNGRKGAWFASVRILNVKEKWQMPICNHLDEQNSRKFTNDMVGKVMYCSSVVGDDMRRMQGIEFKVLQGYYFDSGYNCKLKEFITDIFNERLKMKAEKNPMQLVYKLMMNGCYGRLILKPIETEYKFITRNGNFKKFLEREWEVIKEFEVLGNDSPWSHIVSVYKEIYRHWSAPHLGVMILDHSKRIMNRLHKIAHDMDIPIFYMDTDSMHLLNDDVIRMSETYKTRHSNINGGELIGKKLGQFHNDFNLKAIGPVELGKFKSADVRSEEFIAYGKKCYLHKLTAPSLSHEGVNVKSHSFAMKGFTESSIYDVCNRNLITVEELYENVYNGSTYKANLLAGGRCSFQFNNKMKVSSRSKMTRTIRCVV